MRNLSDRIAIAARTSGYATGIFLAIICLAIGLLVVYFLYFVQAVTGVFSPLSKEGGNINQWCTKEVQKQIRSPYFSADGSKFVLTLQGSCKIGVYTINSESVVYLQPPKESAVFDANFDPTSATITFILARQIGPEIIDFQLAISQIDGSGLRVLTSSDTRKSDPSYSFDGKKSSSWEVSVAKKHLQVIVGATFMNSIFSRR